MKTFSFLLLFTAFSIHLSAQQPATELLNDAIIQAKKENKNILIKFEASWCGWCKRMTKQLKDERVKEYFEKNYVIVPIVAMESAKNKHLENPGSNDILGDYGGAKAGLPFFVIIDYNAVVLTNSFNDFGQNLGCPASPEEVEVFIKKLEATSDMSASDVENITAVFTLKN